MPLPSWKVNGITGLEFELDSNDNADKYVSLYAIKTLYFQLPWCWDFIFDYSLDTIELKYQ